MAESKNVFLKGKMNKDLDNRLLGEGEYRDALNISVGKSENNTVGSLQNILGNEKILIPNSLIDPSMKCIGAYMDNNNNRIFQFSTNYNDPNPAEIIIPTSGNMQITVYDFDTQTYTILVSGLFLNLATNPEFTITGINLLENLLFWTDNRNQPRKINVNNALQNPSNSSTPYYTNETQISVAKYAPVDPIILYKKFTAKVTNIINATEIELDNAVNLTSGMTVISDTISGGEYIITTDVTKNLDGSGTIFLYGAPSTPISINDELTFLISTMTNKSDDPNWPGDSSFLEDKYVRFSYRFKYDDNEYSLMAPFTQITYIPKQKGYFIAGDESSAFRSTVLNWFENNVNNIELLIPLPDSGNNILNSYKIIELDILYKESDAITIKVFETITVQTISQKSLNNNVYIQQYQSQKPYKTLPEQETTRVYDKVPVRARAQESISNRIVYGNYYDKYTPPSSIDYYVAVQPKSDIYTNFIEYPNHTVKQNRNYQVGFILSDKFGRQSPVLLSQVDLEGTTVGGTKFGGSTIYSPYTGINNIEFPGVKEWFGNALLLVVDSPIVSDRDIPNGTPGLYAIVSGVIPNSNDGFEISAGEVNPNNIFNFTLSETVGAQLNMPKVGGYLRGKYTDYVRIRRIDTLADSYNVITVGAISDIYNYNPANIPDIKYSYDINPIGWYSYKVVVRQQEQDYYNVYLPGMLNGYPVSQTYGTQVTYSTTPTVANPILENGINTSDFPVGETDKTAHIVLTNDNINKVPRDLAEVGPDQKQYRSSVQLYGRVTNTAETGVSIEGIADAPNYKYIGNSFTYDVASNPQYAFVGTGNGIQSRGANKDIPGTPPTANPDRWYGNTVVVSNTIVGGIGKIVFTPPNVLDARNSPSTDPDYRVFDITRAENIQYYPTKKADVVSSIATATDFSFLDNSVENITGKAALNLYQLQTNPLIGRVNTVIPIGVESADMTPFLSVYETKPDYSLLDLFWETSTTGLISDLNIDINTGYEGPIGFTPIEYVHYEFQDKNGDGEVEGEADSKYVTNRFYPKNSTGLSLTDTEITFISIADGTPGSNRINDFGLEKQITGAQIGSWRIYINNDFVFNYNAINLESYTFTVNVLDNNTGISNILTLTGRLRNNEPEFIGFPDFVNITQVTETITTFSGVNGSFSNAITGLQYRIITGDTVPSSFNLNPATGELKLTNTSINLGTYYLTIRLTDAINFSQNPPLGTSTVGSPAYFGSLYTENIIEINVGSNPVPYWIRPQYTSVPGLFNTSGPQSETECEITTPTAYPYKYGIAYIGNKNITLDSTGFNANLPIAPDSGGKYQFANSIEIVNGLNQSPPVTVIPEGLTQGTVKWTVEVSLTSRLFDQDFYTLQEGDVIIYYRDQNAIPTAPWQIVADDNNVNFYSAWEDGVGGELVVEGDVSTPPNPYTIAKRYISFTTTNPFVGITGEWAVAVRLYTDVDGCWQGGLKVKTEDANFTYSPLDYNTPIVTSHVYQTGIQLDYFGTTISGVPWDDQDARRGIAYTSPVNKAIAVDTISPTVQNIILETFNPQIVIGLRIQNSDGVTFIGDVIATNVDGNPNKIAITKDFFNPIDAGRNCIFTDEGNLTTRGTLYATTDLATHVKKFYIDPGLTQEWNPPVANKFYNFWQPARPYAIPATSAGFNKPFFSAKINANGEIIELATPANTVQTAWRKVSLGTLINYGRNINNAWS